MKLLFTPLFALIFSSSVSAAPKLATLPINEGKLLVHTGIYLPESSPKADIFYFHGYGDRFENHSKLFRAWTDSGFRVIAFDLPSHGGTRGGEWQDLDWYTFDGLAGIAATLEAQTLEDPHRPLILAGWSTGGLLALRMTQSPSMSLFSRKPSGLILYAPGVAVKKCVGTWACQISNETLSHDESLWSRDITPGTPLSRVNFAIQLLLESARSRSEALPSGVPTLVFAAGDQEDKYVPTSKVKKWVLDQRERSESRIIALQCQGARHELDNESGIYGGSQVRRASAQFVNSVLNGSPGLPRIRPSFPCQFF